MKHKENGFNKPSLCNLYRYAAGTEPVEKMTDKILAHCFRQNGLVDVYRKLMRHTDTIINLRSYPVGLYKLGAVYS
jgi:hypothetical protein